MKRVLFSTILLFVGIIAVMAQGAAVITFDKTTHNFGSFPESEPVVTCVFKFKNTGDRPLIIHQAIASCGCTVPTYTKSPVQPGESGEVSIKYDGTGKFPGHFMKSITLRTNCEDEMVRLRVKGNMVPTQK